MQDILIANGEPVPSWLHGISDLCRELEEEEDPKRGGDIPNGAPPVCATVASRHIKYLYATLAYFAVPFEKAPESFIKRWFRYRTPYARRTLLERYGAYRSELDEYNWMKHMFQRDDVRMLRILRIHPSCTISSSIDNGAIRCTDEFLLQMDSKEEFNHLLVRAVVYSQIAIFQRICAHFDTPINSALWHTITSAMRRTGFLVRRMGLPMLRFAHEHGWEPPSCMAMYFARDGHIEGLEWLRSVNYPCARMAFNGAIRAQRVDVLEYLWTHEWHGLGNVNLVVGIAARSGHISMVQWFRDHGCEWHPSMFAYAVIGGIFKRERDTDALHAYFEALIAMGCPPFGEFGNDVLSACQAAARRRNGGLQTLQWLLARGHLVDDLARRNAASCNNLQVLAEMGPPGDATPLRAILRATSIDSHHRLVGLDTMVWLILEWPCYEVNNINCLLTIAWLFVTKRCKFTDTECLHLMNLLVERGCPISNIIRNQWTEKEVEGVLRPHTNRDLLKAWVLSHDDMSAA